MVPQLTILVIDDDADIARTAARLLSSQGYKVAIHDRGFNSTNLIDQLRPNLVLLDVNMPFLSGDQLVAVIRRYRNLAHIPIVFFSSNDEAALRDMVAEHGVAGYIPKSALTSNFTQRVGFFIRQAERNGGAL